MLMFEVSLSMPALEATDPREAAKLFLSALMSADWTDGLVFSVQSNEIEQPLGWTEGMGIPPKIRAVVKLTSDDVAAALNWKPSDDALGADAAAERRARAAAEPLGWRAGGDYIYDSNVFDSWKEAVSWSGDDGRDEAEQSSNLYSTWRECCKAEDIEF